MKKKPKMGVGIATYECGCCVSYIQGETPDEYCPRHKLFGVLIKLESTFDTFQRKENNNE